MIAENIIPKDDLFIEKIVIQNKSEDFYFNYFYQEMMSDCPDNYKINQKIGENESYICLLIRQDSIEEFITYINKNTIST